MSTLTRAPFDLPAAFLQRVERRYGVPPRAYHSWRHIKATLGHFETVAAGPGWKQPLEVALAVLFHDVVYDAARKDNEAKSAIAARVAITEELAGRVIDHTRVTDLIEMTARHGSVTTQDLDAAHFLDCDMAVLGAPNEEFDAYDRGVAEEYAPHVNAMLYRFGRRRFLTKLLEADRIYLSDFFHQRLDLQARANLRRALGRE